MFSCDIREHNGDDLANDKYIFSGDALSKEWCTSSMIKRRIISILCYSISLWILFYLFSKS